MTRDAMEMKTEAMGRINLFTYKLDEINYGVHPATDVRMETRMQLRNERIILQVGKRNASRV